MQWSGTVRGCIFLAGERLNLSVYWNAVMRLPCLCGFFKEHIHRVATLYLHTSIYIYIFKTCLNWPHQSHVDFWKWRLQKAPAGGSHTIELPQERIAYSILVSSVACGIFLGRDPMAWTLCVIASNLWSKACATKNSQCDRARLSEWTRRTGPVGLVRKHLSFQMAWMTRHVHQSLCEMFPSLCHETWTTRDVPIPVSWNMLTYRCQCDMARLSHAYSCSGTLGITPSLLERHVGAA